ncbi:MAG: lipopolysaccharide biosynthesis protein [Pseudomonadota bacterium]
MTNYRVYSTFGSAVLTVSMNWFNRLVGIISIAILARLLLPDDFGVIAMASLIVALADTVFNFGVHVPLIQRQDATQEHYDSAWTLRLLQTSLSTAALFLAAPYAADYFNDERVTIVAQCLSFTLLLAGLENIGIVDFQKKMQFGAEFRFRFIRRLVGFTVTVVLAYALRSYWAMVVGMLAEKLAGVVLSYAVHTMRPRFSFSKFREIFGVSQWMLIFSLGRYLRLKLHQLIVGRWEPTATVGAYSIANELSMMPTTAVLQPLNRALFPAFSKAQHTTERLKSLFLMAQSVQTLIAVPAAAGLALVADEIVLVLLGDNWGTAAGFVRILALINIAQALTTSGTYILLSTGRQRLNAIVMWSQVAIFAGLVMTPLVEKSAMDVARLLLVATMFGLAVQFYFVKRSIAGLRFRDIAACSVRPLIASSIMAAALIYLPFPVNTSAIVLLFGKATSGALVFVAATYGLWRAAGRPDGAEVYLADKIASISRSAVSRFQRHQDAGRS